MIGYDENRLITEEQAEQVPGDENKNETIRNSRVYGGGVDGATREAQQQNCINLTPTANDRCQNQKVSNQARVTFSSTKPS